MVLTTLSLKEMLEHLKELADANMQKTRAFDIALTEYTYSVLGNHDPMEMKNALDYLQSIDSIGTLNISNMIEQLECQ